MPELSRAVGIERKFIDMTRNDVLCYLDKCRKPENEDPLHKWIGTYNTEGKNDPCNHPSVNSCLIRVPDTVNSKNNKVVEVVQSWNKVRLAANSMLFKFQIELARRKLAHKSMRQRGKGADPYYNTYRIAGKRSTARSKTYRHFGYTNRSQPYSTIDWIETNILQGAGIGDYRKITLELVLAPYLVNVKKCDYDVAYNTIVKWLDKCGRIRPLDFKPRCKVNYAVKHANHGPVLYPMKLDTIKSKYPEMYIEIFALQQQQQQQELQRTIQ